VGGGVDPRLPIVDNLFSRRTNGGPGDPIGQTETGCCERRRPNVRDDRQPSMLGTPAVGTSKPAPPPAVATVGPKDDLIPTIVVRRLGVVCSVTGFLGAWFIAFHSRLPPAHSFRAPPSSKWAIPPSTARRHTKWQHKYRIWLTATPDRVSSLRGAAPISAAPRRKSSKTIQVPCHGSG